MQDNQRAYSPIKPKQPFRNKKNDGRNKAAAVNASNLTLYFRVKIRSVVGEPEVNVGIFFDEAIKGVAGKQRHPDVV